MYPALPFSRRVIRIRKPLRNGSALSKIPLLTYLIDTDCQMASRGRRRVDPKRERVIQVIRIPPIQSFPCGICMKYICACTLI